MGAGWIELAAVMCASLIVLGAASLLKAGQSFSIIQGRVVGKGVSSVGSGPDEYTVQTVSVLLETKDRVYGIRPGDVGHYIVSNEDSQILRVGAEVKILVTAHPAAAKLLDFAPAAI